jgi:hypothetical protein
VGYKNKLKNNIRKICFLIKNDLSLLAEKDKCMGKKLYHKSNPIFRKSILRNGLIPKVGECYSLYWEGKTDKELTPYIFMYDHETIEDGEYDSTYDDDIYAIEYLN